MTGRVLAIASFELRILMRNRWVATAVGLMIAFCVLIALAGSAPVGTIRADRLTVAAASLSTLMVYLVPLIALLISYDSISGEALRGTLSLVLTYPASRLELLAGKTVAQLSILAVAVVAGLVAAALVVAARGGVSGAGFAHLFRLSWSACLLGAAFLAIGNLVSTATREPGTSAALAIAIWVVAVVMLDVALLAALVADDGGTFTQHVFPWLLVGSPTDAFRLFNIAHLDAEAIADGIGAASGKASLPAILPLLSLALWPVAATAAALGMLWRYQP